jgi:hypothetical protein
MEALTQCWFTRVHRPARARQRQSDGAVSSTCRYCQRTVVSWDRENWTLSNGLDVSRLVETTSGRTLTLFDTLGDLIIRRFPVRHLDDEGAVTAFKLQLRAEHGLDEPGSMLELRDSAPPRAKRKPKAVPLSDPL